MGILFVVEGANKPRINKKFICPECEAVYGRFYGEKRPCKTCHGLGQDPNDKPLGDFAFEVEDSHAISILHDLLNYGTHEKPYDEPCSLNPSDVLVRLALSDFRIESMVRPIFEYVDAKANDCPPEEALRVYVENLTAMAEKALDIDEDIVYRPR